MLEPNNIDGTSTPENQNLSLPNRRRFLLNDASSLMDMGCKDQASGTISLAIGTQDHASRISNPPVSYVVPARKNHLYTSRESEKQKLFNSSIPRYRKSLGLARRF